MKRGDYIAVWLSDEAARAFLGLAKSASISRWCVLGTVETVESEIGIWLKVDEVQEKSGSGGKYC